MPPQGVARSRGLPQVTMALGQGCVETLWLPGSASLCNHGNRVGWGEPAERRKSWGLAGEATERGVGIHVQLSSPSKAQLPGSQSPQVSHFLLPGLTALKPHSPQASATACTE